MKTRLALVAVSLAVLVAACGDDASTTTTTTTLPDGSVVAEFETADGQTYRVLVSGPAADQVRSAFQSGEGPGIPNGIIRPGDGGVNTGHDWHVVEVEFADMTTEVCDATVSYVDDLGYEEFVRQHGDRFCPWGAELVGLNEG